MRTEAARNTRRKLLSEWRRHEVLDAVRRIFARLGYAAVNVEKIAKERVWQREQSTCTSNPKKRSLPP